MILGWFHRLDWVIAWRHLRNSDDRPAWVVPLLLGSVYVVLVGIILMTVASTLDPAATVSGPFDLPPDLVEPSKLQSYLRTFGFFTAGAGVMALTFGLLALFFNLLPTIITMSVALGCMALVVVLSLMSGLEGDMRDKILNQKAHIRVSRADARPFEDYESLAETLAAGEGIAGASPYLEGEIMVRSGLDRQGALVVGILPGRHKSVSNLEDIITQGDYAYLLAPEDIPSPDPLAFADDGTPWRLRHLEDDAADAKLPGLDDPELGEQERGEGIDPGDADPVPAAGAATAFGALDQPADASGTDDSDERWEDPLQVLEEDGKAAAPRSPAPGAPGGLLRDLDAAVREAPAANAPEEDDGWEDPAQLVPNPAGDDAAPEDARPPEEEPEVPQATEAEAEAEGVAVPILIGRELMMELGIRLGEPVQLITPIVRTTPAGQIPGVLGAKVAGVFYSGMYEYDRKNVYAPLSVVQRFLLVGDRVSGIEVALDDVDRIDAGKAEVERLVDQLDRDEELIVEDWRDLNRNLFSAMFLEKVAMFIALLFVVLVASFGILASNLMSVMEKGKEIAIMKAMGSTDGSILRVFIAEGLCVGLLGSFGGIAQGIALCWGLDHFGLLMFGGVFYVETLPVVVDPVEVAVIGIAALVIVCISSLYPALVASRLRPVDGLRQGET